MVGDVPVAMPGRCGRDPDLRQDLLWSARTPLQVGLTRCDGNGTIFVDHYLGEALK